MPLSFNPHSPTPARNQTWRYLLSAVVVIALAGAAGCSDGDDDGDLLSFCAVVRDRDLGASLVERSTGPQEPVETPQGTFSPADLDGFSRSFANIVAEDSPSELEDDAELYREALLAALDGAPLTGSELDAAAAAGDRISAFTAAECPEPEP